jgi:hypothetical protein
MRRVSSEGKADPESTEGRTPPHGTQVQSLLADSTRDEPEQKTAVYSQAEQALVADTAPASRLPWSGGLKPHDRIGPYELLERLHRGDTAELYVARALDGQLVALKLASPDNVHTELFLEDARCAAALKQPGLVRVLDCGQDDGRTFLVMEYVHGRDLAALARCMTESGGASRPFALRAALELTRTLAALHQAGVIHGSVNASHVMVSSQGEVKLCARIGRGDDVGAAAGVLKELMGDASAAFQRRFTTAAELEAVLAAEVAQVQSVDAGMMVRALCGLSLASEKRRVAEALRSPHRPRPSSPSRPAARRQRRSRLWLALAVALGAGLLAAGALFALR